jgi:hypothetical protein
VDGIRNAGYYRLCCLLGYSKERKKKKLKDLILVRLIEMTGSLFKSDRSYLKLLAESDASLKQLQKCMWNCAIPKYLAFRLAERRKIGCL